MSLLYEKVIREIKWSRLENNITKYCYDLSEIISTLII
jgi:hypothetical protein